MWVANGKWFQEHRITWAAEMARVYGYVNRHHLERMFGISTPQASIDLGEAAKRALLTYNRCAKRYEPTECT